MVFLIFIHILIEHSASKQWRPRSAPHYVESGLGLHDLPTSHKKDARLKRVITLNLVRQLPYLVAYIANTMDPLKSSLIRVCNVSYNGKGGSAVAQCQSA